MGLNPPPPRSRSFACFGPAFAVRADLSRLRRSFARRERLALTRSARTATAGPSQAFSRAVASYPAVVLWARVEHELAG